MTFGPTEGASWAEVLEVVDRLFDGMRAGSGRPTMWAPRRIPQALVEKPAYRTLFRGLIPLASHRLYWEH